MTMLSNFLKPAVAAAALLALLNSAVVADTDRLTQLMQELQTADPQEARRIAADIQLEWEKSGSATADLLLSRGRKAMDAGNFASAIEHFTALTDHAPEFAEGWVSRAMAFAQSEKYGLALDDIETALEINPQHFEAIIGLGAILEMIRQPEAAYEAYQMVRPIHPHHPAVTEALERLEPVAKGRKL
ncbi:tetratricopeptide repeat protein [Cognatishimia maritima]|uniref:TPR repeat-containing protein n=1 Tax=Cognatishimia maritima TaxID=870908 RepID=A0A1M5V1S8_9RHOB|nr:tetratricopeptide repeat protein [Cognatishimia maritima]SHH69169.1 TPR repeat-containing protein [Cognatishimia maritima]